ncbi:unnamed protein product [Lepeophtheirus salmonis]|uniref:(salmon louse) hypothetical protein n=1 Tax=Lepeophtheirus salmonis TaxID=72036 RepID=A0A7R8HAI6_LEPSM|nr:unnamed protein product [Lepeophtheirus salmonis]CAF2971907.1 unnamed protein product [Lepeophtheirus salmonis]
MSHKFIETESLDESGSSFRAVESTFKEDRYEALLNSAFDDIMQQRYMEVVDNYRRASISTGDSPLGLMFDRILERLADLDESDLDSVMMKDLESVTSTMIDNYIETLLLNVIHKASKLYLTVKQLILIPNPDANPSHEKASHQRSKSGHCNISVQKYSPKALTLREYQRKCLNIAHDKFWNCLLNIREKTGVKTVIDPIEIEDTIKKSVDESIWTSSIYDEMEKAFSDLKMSQDKF